MIGRPGPMVRKRAATPARQAGEAVPSAIDLVETFDQRSRAGSPRDPHRDNLVVPETRAVQAPQTAGRRRQKIMQARCDIRGAFGPAWNWRRVPAVESGGSTMMQLLWS